MLSHYEACKQNYVIVSATLSKVDAAIPDAVNSMVLVYRKIGASKLDQSAKYDLEGRFKAAAKVSEMQQCFNDEVFSELRAVLNYPVIIITAYSICKNQS